MTDERTNAFVKWLDEELAHHHLTDHQLAKQAGMSHSVFSRARKGYLPKWEACASIAKALRVNPVVVFMAAGLIPTPPDLDNDFERLKHVYSSTSPTNRKKIVRMAEVIVEED
jgi:transcriptional regulator with XRE-family HTH domain